MTSIASMAEVARREASFDRWGRYMLPNPKNPNGKVYSWTRVTTVVEAPSDPYALFEWKQRKAALGFAADPTLLPRPNWDATEHRDEINTLVAKAMDKSGSNEASTKGSDFHAGAAFLDESNIFPKESSPLYHPLLEQYRAALEKHDLVPLPEYIERSVVIPGADVQAANVAGCAGTVDRILLHKPSGKYVMSDIKSRHSKTDLNYNCSKWGLQLYAYSQASHTYNWDSESFTPMPKLAPMGCIISVDLRTHDEFEKPIKPENAIRMFRFKLADYAIDWDTALKLRAYRSMSKKRKLEEL